MPEMTLKALRINKGYSREKVADAVGVSAITIKNWELGKTFPTQPFIEKLCELYGVCYDNIKFRVD